ncbi:MAG: PilZ domain-containing protein [Gemmatimonadales bacterium]|nr:PilZ domain-containing protein [Gemmatimonadales bacterium]
MTRSVRWSEPKLDRRIAPRAEYRRTAPGLLLIEGFRCAVRDLGPGGLRVEPAPAGRAWELDQHVAGELHLRTIGPLMVGGRIHRIDRAGLSIIPDSGDWPDASTIEIERAALVRNHQERRAAPRLPLPVHLPGATPPRTPLRDVSANGLRYALGPTEHAPVPGSRLEGELRLDVDTVIQVRGRVVRHGGREVAIALDPPGLTPEILALLRQRFFRTDS